MLHKILNLLRPKVMHLSDQAEPSEPGSLATMLCGKTVRLRGGKFPKRACAACVVASLAEHESLVENHNELVDYYNDTTRRLTEIESVVTASGGARR